MMLMSMPPSFVVAVVAVVAFVVVVVVVVVAPLHWNRLFFMQKETLRPRIFISARKLSGRLNKRHQMKVFSRSCPLKSSTFSTAVR